MNAFSANPDPQALEALVSKSYDELAAGYAGVLISIGSRLGLFSAMAGGSPLTSDEVARRSGCAERYVREWLNALAAAGYIRYHPVSSSYELTAEQTCVLADGDSPANIALAWEIVASFWADQHKLIEAFRTGDGVSWGNHDERLYCSCAAFYRNAYQMSLVSDWLPALDGVVAQLEAGARVADVGCGLGHSTRIMAQAFPKSRFFGLDSHAASIEQARQLARNAGIAERTAYEVGDAAALPPGEFDLICFFDCLHDMGWPVEAAKAARRALRPGGALMVVEPAAGDRVEENFNTVGRLYYGGSTLLCCPHAISEGGSHVLGAQAGEAKLSRLLEEAGFAHVSVAIRTAFNLILQARF